MLFNWSTHKTNTYTCTHKRMLVKIRSGSYEMEKSGFSSQNGTICSTRKWIGILTNKNRIHTWREKEHFKRGTYAKNIANGWGDNNRKHLKYKCICVCGMWRAQTHIRTRPYIQKCIEDCYVILFTCRLLFNWKPSRKSTSFACAGDVFAFER